MIERVVTAYNMWSKLIVNFNLDKSSDFNSHQIGPNDSDGWLLIILWNWGAFYLLDKQS